MARRSGSKPRSEPGLDRGCPDLEVRHASDFVALLGRRDAPTDGVEDYCGRLGEALLARGRLLEPRRVPWQERGWWRALWWLWRESARWDGKWVVVQYTAMGWSRRGFPVGLLAVFAMLRCRPCRIAVMFHDPCGFPGRRWIDRARRGVQQWVMRRAYRCASRTISNIPVDRVGWLPRVSTKAVSIPVGSNVGPIGPRGEPAEGTTGKGRTVAVFGVTSGESGEREVAAIARAVSRAAQTVPMLRLVVMGRGASEAEEDLRRAIGGVDVPLTVLGVLPAGDVSDLLSAADVLLFVRGALSGQRTSGIAGIACGLPVVGYAGSETGAPITDAGVMLVPAGDDEALAAALTRVLTDGELRRRLRRQSVEAYRRYFSWDAIAERFAEALPR